MVKDGQKTGSLPTRHNRGKSGVVRGPGINVVQNNTNARQSSRTTTPSLRPRVPRRERKAGRKSRDENPSDPWNSALQDGFNNARKAEVRVRQLTATRQVKMRQRQQYEEKLKRSYLQERQGH